MHDVEQDAGAASFHDIAMRAYPRLARNRKRVLKYVLDHLQDAVFLTAGQLAQKTRVDGATVVRTARDVGFDGYGDFVEAARRTFLLSMSPRAIPEPPKGSRTPTPRRCQAVVQQDLSNLQTCLRSIDPAQIHDLAVRVHKSRRTLIVGLDFAATLTYYLEYALLAIGLPVVGVTSGGGRLRTYLQSISSRDLVIGISHRRCLRETVTAVQQARRQKAFTFALTDSELSPLAKAADACVLAPVTGTSFWPSYVAPISVLNTLIMECSQLRRRHTLKFLEALRREYDEGERWYTERASKDS